ncbi:UNVERIFIED_CONTAM: hypothetical protein HDU68_001777 [Siphonaria sp. JEL0065]|nr:hypothetical protein HDU68_001777 [Siphonaria sp. JEL0065]
MHASPSLGAYKPFVTEYKLAFTDPRGSSKSKAKKKKNQPAAPPSTAAAPVPSYIAIPVQQQLSQQPTNIFGLPALPQSGIVAACQGGAGRKSKSTKNLWAPPPQRNGVESTSLTLPGMAGNHEVPFDVNLPLIKTFRRRRVLNPVVKSTTEPPKHRYNILSGDEIMGEQYSGYKEGRRAVIQTFAHIDMTTNARTPGYNIISARDYLTDDAEALAV